VSGQNTVVILQTLLFKTRRTERQIAWLQNSCGYYSNTSWHTSNWCSLFWCFVFPI